MRNPFQKVFCEECEYCMLEIKPHYSKGEQLEYARCMASPKKLGKGGLSRAWAREPDYWYCTTIRTWPFSVSFCFKFKAKEAQNEQDNST